MPQSPINTRWHPAIAAGFSLLSPELLEPKLTRACVRMLYSLDTHRPPKFYGQSIPVGTPLPLAKAWPAVMRRRSIRFSDQKFCTNARMSPGEAKAPGTSRLPRHIKIAACTYTKPPAPHTKFPYIVNFSLHYPRKRTIQILSEKCNLSSNPKIRSNYSLNQHHQPIFYSLCC